MNNKQVREAIISLLQRKLSQGGYTFDELGNDIDTILNLKASKKNRDKDAPKRTKTAYVFFCQKHRPETVKNMEEEASVGEPVKSVDVVRSLAEKWKELKTKCDEKDESAMEEMQEYKSKSEEDKLRWIDESAAYRSQPV